MLKPSSTGDERRSLLSWTGKFDGTGWPRSFFVSDEILAKQRLGGKAAALRASLSAKEERSTRLLKARLSEASEEHQRTRIERAQQQEMEQSRDEASEDASAAYYYNLRRLGESPSSMRATNFEHARVQQEVRSGSVLSIRSARAALGNATTSPSALRKLASSTPAARSEGASAAWPTRRLLFDTSPTSQGAAADDDAVDACFRCTSDHASCAHAEGARGDVNGAHACGNAYDVDSTSAGSLAPNGKPTLPAHPPAGALRPPPPLGTHPEPLGEGEHSPAGSPASPMSASSSALLIYAEAAARVREALLTCGVLPYEAAEAADVTSGAMVTLDGEWMGIVRDMEQAKDVRGGMLRLRQKLKHGLPFASIDVVAKDMELRVRCAGAPPPAAHAAAISPPSPVSNRLSSPLAVGGDGEGEAAASPTSAASPTRRFLESVRYLGSPLSIPSLGTSSDSSRSRRLLAHSSHPSHARKAVAHTESSGGGGAWGVNGVGTPPQPQVQVVGPHYTEWPQGAMLRHEGQPLPEERFQRPQTQHAHHTNISAAALAEARDRRNHRRSHALQRLAASSLERRSETSPAPEATPQCSPTGSCSGSFADHESHRGQEGELDVASEGMEAKANTCAAHHGRFGSEYSSEYSFS